MAKRTSDLDGSDVDARGLDDSGVLHRGGGWELRSASASGAGVDAPEDGAGAPLTERGARRVYGALCVVAHAAGAPGPGQRRELAEFQEFLGLSDACARLLERQAQRGSGTLRVGKRPAELEFLMGAMIDVAAADGVVPRVVRRLIDRVNERARWSRDRVEAAIAAALARANPRQADDDDASEIFDATLLPEPPARRSRAADDSGIFDATLLPEPPARRPRAADDLRASSSPRASSLRGLEDSGEDDLLVVGSPWFEHDD